MKYSWEFKLECVSIYKKRKSGESIVALSVDFQIIY